MPTNIQKDLANIANSVLKIIFSVLNNAKIKTTQSEAKRKFPIEVSKQGFDVFLPGYYNFADKGRKSGKRPPVSAILDWLKENKIRPPKDITTKSFAFAIANSIGNKGTRPKPFLKRLNEELSLLFVEYTTNKINNTLKGKK